MILDNLEHLLATYFVPAVPIEENVRKRHAKSMRVLARKFFMWLLRARKFPRALQVLTPLQIIQIAPNQLTYVVGIFLVIIYC
jgi:hypothetical protein